MKIKTAVQPQPVRTSYTPLKASFGIVIDGGGSKTQFYYTNANTFIPITDNLIRIDNIEECL